MNINTWYTFENENHSYGYTLFYPLEINDKICGMYIICNDSGPNYGSQPGTWMKTGFAYLNIPTYDAIEYYDAKGRTPRAPRSIIYELFVDGESGFVNGLKKYNVEWLN